MAILALVRSWSHSQVALVFVALVIVTPVLYLLIRAIYRIAFHPLVAFPGPKLRAISHLPHAFSAWQGRQAFHVRELHQRYGEVVRIAPDLLSFTAPGAWKDIYGHQASKSLLKYGYFKVRPDAQPMLTSSGADHTRQRAAFAHGFSERAISGQEPALIEHVDQFVAQLKKHTKDEHFDIGMLLRFLSFDIIGHLAISTHFGCVEQNTYHPWVSILVNWFRAVSFVTNANAMGLLKPFIMPFAPFKLLMGVKDHLSMSAEKVHQRLAAGDDPNVSDLWTYILRNRGEKALTLGEMEVNAAVLLIAGTEPIADALCGAIYFLARNPAPLKKLRLEIESHVSTESEITISSTGKMAFLHAVLNEGMRMYTPIPGGMRRQVPEGGAIIAGYSVPAKTVVSVWQLPSFTLASNFASPDTFIPERWFPADHAERPKSTLSDHQEAFQPFSVGPKNCLGKGLSYAEMKLILARFLWNFDFELVDDAFAIDRQRSYVFRDRPPLRVKLYERKH